MAGIKNNIFAECRFYKFPDMKAVKLTGIKEMQIMNVPVPKILLDTDVLIKMKVVGVCGSDVHYYDTGRIGSLVVDYPFAVGHEGAGIVEAVGKGVTSVQPGYRIAVEPAVSCGECQQCLAGRPHTCLNNKFLGCPGQLEGNLVEYIVMDEKQCLKISEKLSYDEAALSEPLSIGLYANKQAVLKRGMEIAILGFGPIGMSVMLTAKAIGAGRTFVTDKIDARLDKARETGAEWAGNPLVDDVVAEIIDKVPDQPDIVYECSGDQAALDNAVDLVKPGGKVMIIGIPEFDRWSFSSEKARRKEVSFIHVRRQNNCVEEVLEMMEKGRVDASRMVTHRFPLEKSAEAFDMVSHYRDGVMKAMIEL